MARQNSPDLGDLRAITVDNGPGRRKRIIHPNPRAEDARAPRRAESDAARRDTPAPAEPASRPRPGLAGRAGRVRYLTHLGASLTVPAVVFTVAIDPLHAFYEANPQVAFIAATLAGAGVMLWQTAAGVTRAHDRGHGGWVAALHCVPGLNLLVIAYLALFQGEREENRFGPPPRRVGLFGWLAYFALVLVPIGLAPAAALEYDTYLQERLAAGTQG